MPDVGRYQFIQNGGPGIAAACVLDTLTGRFFYLGTVDGRSTWLPIAYDTGTYNIPQGTELKTTPPT